MFAELIPVNSSSIRAVDYQSGTLLVQFHSSGTVYSHPGVPVWVYLEFMAAASMGAYYARFIKGKYR